MAAPVYVPLNGYFKVLDIQIGYGSTSIASFSLLIISHIVQLY